MNILKIGISGLLILIIGACTTPMSEPTEILLATSTEGPVQKTPASPSVPATIVAESTTVGLPSATPDLPISPVVTNRPPRYAPSLFTPLINSEYVSCGAISPRGTYLALQSFASTTPSDSPLLILWDTVSWSEVWRRESPSLCASLEISRDEHTLATGINAGGTNPHIIVTLVNLADASPSHGIVDFYDARDLTFSPDGQLLAVANGYVLLYEISGIRPFMPGGWLADKGSDEPTRVLKPPDGTGYVQVAEFSPVELLLAIGTTDGVLLLWHLDELQPRPTLQTAGECLTNSSAGVQDIAFSRDGSLLAATFCRESMVVYDLSSHAELARYHTSKPPLALEFSPDNKAIAIGMEGEVLLYSTATRSARCTLDANGHRVQTVGFSTDGTHVLATTDEGAAVRWDILPCSEN